MKSALKLKVLPLAREPQLYRAGGGCATSTRLEYYGNMSEEAQLTVLKHLYISRMCIFNIHILPFVLSLTFLLNFIG